MRGNEKKDYRNLKIDPLPFSRARSVKSVPLKEGGRFPLRGENEGERVSGLAVQGVVDAWWTMSVCEVSSSAGCRSRRAAIVGSSHLAWWPLSLAGPVANAVVRGGHRVTSQRAPVRRVPSFP